MTNYEMWEVLDKRVAQGKGGERCELQSDPFESMTRVIGMCAARAKDLPMEALKSLEVIARDMDRLMEMAERNERAWRQDEPPKDRAVVAIGAVKFPTDVGSTVVEPFTLQVHWGPLGTGESGWLQEDGMTVARTVDDVVTIFFWCDLPKAEAAA